MKWINAHIKNPLLASKQAIKLEKMQLFKQVIVFKGLVKYCSGQISYFTNSLLEFTFNK